MKSLESIITGGTVYFIILYFIDSNSNLGGVEYLIVFIGLIVSIIGFGKEDNLPYWNYVSCI